MKKILYFCQKYKCSSDFIFIEMIHIDEKLYFYLIFIIPILWIFYFGLQVWKRRARTRFADKTAMQKLAPERSVFKTWIKFAVIALALISLVVALANPKVGTKLKTIKREGVDIVFAIDVSKSMLAEDTKPNRLEKAKRITSEVINNLHGDRIGLVAYAGQAYPQLPLTTDYSAAKMFLQNMNTNMLSSQGTAIQQAINVAGNYFQKESPTTRLLFILSDGEDHEMGASETATQAKDNGIRVFTIGIGTEKGSTIAEKNGQTQILKRDLNGEVVITKLNKGLLEEIAQEGGGKYLDGTNTQNVVDAIKNTLEGVEKNEYESQMFSDYKDQFQWFVGFALLLLIGDIFISYRKTAWVQKLNLFGEKQQQ